MRYPKLILIKNPSACYEKYQVVDKRRVDMLRELLGSEHYDELYLSWGNAEEDACNEWVKIAEIVQAIRNSAFYRQIDRHMRISRNVHQTNILRHDQHYKALFQIWRKVCFQPHNERSINASKELPDDPDNCFASYVFLLLLWTMQQKMDIRFDPSDRIVIENNCLRALLHGSDNLCHYVVQMESDNAGQNVIRIEILPPYDTYSLPKDCHVTSQDLVPFSHWLSFSNGLLEIRREADPSDYKQLIGLFSQKGKRPNSAINPSNWEHFVREVQERQRVRKPLDNLEFEIRPLLYSLPTHEDDLPEFDKGPVNQDTIWITITNPEHGKELSKQLIMVIVTYVFSFVIILVV